MICHEIGDRIGEAVALSNRGDVARINGNYADSYQFTAEALKIGRALGDHWTILSCLNILGETANHQENYTEAIGYLHEAIILAHEKQTLQMLTRSLVILGITLIKTGQVAPGIEMLSAAANHPACEDDYRVKAKRCLADSHLSLPDFGPSLQSVVEKIKQE
jgi:tetratricopeptide (TPR) repeat protein